MFSHGIVCVFRCSVILRFISLYPKEEIFQSNDFKEVIKLEEVEIRHV